ncbi:sensor domain-containing protein [Halochromatium sp.]
MADPRPALDDLRDLYQRAREALLSGRLDEAEADFAAHEQDAQTLLEEQRIQETELKLQNEDLRNTRLALEEALARFSTFFYALPIAALILDARGLIREANPAAETLFQLRCDGYQQHVFTRFVAQAERAALSRALRDAEQSIGFNRSDIECRRANGEPFIGDLHLAPVPGEANAEPEFICTVIDRSESAQQRQRLQEQRAQLEAIFQAAPVGIVFVRRRKMLRSNMAWCELIGYAPEELDHLDTRMLYADDEEYERVGRALYTRLDQQGTGRLETRLQHKAGHQLDVTLCAASIEQDQAPGSQVVTILDITERKAAEQALQEREERLRLTLEATNDGLWDLDVASGCMTVNDRYGAMLGYAPDELDLRLKPLIALLHPEDQAPVRELLDQHLSEDRPYALDIRMRCKDGSWRWLHTRGQVVARDLAGQPLRVVGTHTDIHARKLADQALTESNRRLREAERLAVLGHWEYIAATSELTWSAQLYRIFGFDPNEPLPDVNALAERFHPEDAPEFLQKFRRALDIGEHYTFTLRIFRQDGAQRWLFSEGHTECDESGRTLRCFGTAQDVTEREQAQARLREAAKVFESMVDALIVTDADHAIITVNPAFTQITGYTEAAVCAQPVETVLASATDRGFWNPIRTSNSGGRRWQGERWERRQDGTLYRARLSVTALSNERGRIDRYVIVISDTTQLHHTQEQVEFLTQYDPLTGLANRNHFHQRLTQALQHDTREPEQLAILLVDLDRFRVINESLGPETADVLLEQVASDLSQVVQPSATLARLGGDEFGVILPAIGSPEAINDVVAGLQQRCAERRIIGGQAITLTASVGIAVYPLDGLSGDALMRHADVALKQAKARGRQSVQYFEATSTQSPLGRLHLEACLSQALLGDELQLHYQPQLSLIDGALIGAEALLRWNSAELGPVPPQQFIPIAEDMGLIHEIGTWVLRQALDQLAAWDRTGQRLPRLAVNLSILQLEDPTLVDRIARMLEHHELEPERLELELTESMLMRQAGQSAATLEALRHLGVRLAVDDFGTGYSSLAYLHRLPLQQLKIDRSFVDPLPADPHSQAITQAIIALGRSLHLELLAEGIETAEQADWLRDAGCSLAQGYHYARPLSSEAFAAHWLAITCDHPQSPRI